MIKAEKSTVKTWIIAINLKMAEILNQSVGQSHNLNVAVHCITFLENYHVNERMRLRLVDVGVIREAELDINGFTVITGENSSGKSTVLKSIYTLVEPGLNLDSKIMQDIDDIALRLYASLKSESEINPFEGYEKLTN